MMKYSLNIHLIHNEIRQMQIIRQKRLFHWPTVRFLIHKIAPTANDLSNEQPWSAYINDPPKFISFVMCKEHRKYNRTY
ncbi:hypothetical protein D3C76_1588110 [compost metagenome]